MNIFSAYKQSLLISSVTTIKCGTPKINALIKNSLSSTKTLLLIKSFTYSPIPKDTLATKGSV